MPTAARPLRIVFLHLDLGIGGAEQLVVNAAVSALERKHKVKVYTTHHDPSHCFAETKETGPLASLLRVHGDALPRQVLGRFTALCATLRMLYLAAVVLVTEWGQVDALVCDGVSSQLPLLRLMGVPILFYCHFPDKLLCVDRTSAVKRLYRAPLDWIEEITTGMAHVIAVNSKFTAGVFSEAFSRLKRSHPAPVVLYPPINLTSFATRSLPQQSSSSSSSDGLALGPMLSINRFERKKKVMLAVEALAVLRDQLQDSSSGSVDRAAFDTVQLVIAGGYDPRVKENVEYKQELEGAVQQHSLQQHVTFKPNISDTERSELLCAAACVLYTPDREHFGIVPIEAMYAGAPVIAVASGGPLETVVNNETGFLCEQTPAAFAHAMLQFVKTSSLTRTMGAQGHAHVAQRFGLEAFGAAFEKTLLSMVSEHSTASAACAQPGLYYMAAVFAAVIALIAVLVVYRGS